MAFSNRIRNILSHKNVINGFHQQLITQRLYGSYRNSPFLEDVEPVTTKYQITKEPEDWKYVERILPLTTVPAPPKKDEYPSGWKPQAENVDHLPYFVQRTKNHMLPVYLEIVRRGNSKQTVIKKIKGDIWLFEKDLRNFLQPNQLRPLKLYVNELGGYIQMNGDHVNAIKYFLEQKQ